MDDHIRLLASVLGESRVKENINISEHLHTHMGAVVRAFYIATTTKELVKAVEICGDLEIKVLIVGSGSKVALSDQGFPGLVIKNRSDNLRIFGIKGKVSRQGIGVESAFLEADSGVSLGKLTEFSLQQGLGGFELLKNIPGTVGGSLSMNPTLREKVHQVKVWDKNSETLQKDLSQVRQEDVILAVTFHLKAKKEYNKNTF